MAINLLSVATEIAQILNDIATIAKAIQPPTDPAAKAALDRVKTTLATLPSPTDNKAP
jgi:hypothetical protein